MIVDHRVLVGITVTSIVTILYFLLTSGEENEIEPVSVAFIGNSFQFVNGRNPENLFDVLLRFNNCLLCGFVQNLEVNSPLFLSLLLSLYCCFHSCL